MRYCIFKYESFSGICNGVWIYPLILDNPGVLKAIPGLSKIDFVSTAEMHHLLQLERFQCIN
jgi:hypothetical protein